MRTDSSEKLIEIGVVGRPHGIDGGVRVFLHNPDSTVVMDAPSLFLKQSGGMEKTALLNLRPGNRCHLARFKGISNRNDAERLKGAKILIPRDAFPPPNDDDEFYVADLIGLEALDGERIVGRIASSRDQGGIEVIRVVGETEEVEIPLVEDFVDELDISGGRVRLKAIDDLPRTPVRGRFKK